jgi:hypothetical protein
MALSIVSIGIATALSTLIPQCPGRDWWVFASIAIVSVVLYFPLLRVCLPSVWMDGRDRAMALLSRNRR